VPEKKQQSFDLFPENRRSAARKSTFFQETASYDALGSTITTPDGLLACRI
jgi:hypothetical protein